MADSVTQQTAEGTTKKTKDTKKSQDDKALVLCQNLKLRLSVIPAQAENQQPRYALDPRLRGDDRTNTGMTEQTQG